MSSSVDLHLEFLSQRMAARSIKAFSAAGTRNLLDDATMDAKRMETENKAAEAQKMEAEKQTLGEEYEMKRCAEAQHHARAAFSSLRSPLLLCFRLPRESSRP
jgi:hypothetical protein